jgi:hypothetical protein
MHQIIPPPQFQSLTCLKFQRWDSYYDNACRRVGRPDIRERGWKEDLGGLHGSLLTNKNIRLQKLFHRHGTSQERQTKLTDRDIRQRRKCNTGTGNQQSLRSATDLLNQGRSTGLMAVGGAVEGGAGPIGRGFVPNFYLDKIRGKGGVREWLEELRLID